jgi:predicted membrane channel-forming protein YqfA (hemolysin III family)
MRRSERLSRQALNRLFWCCITFLAAGYGLARAVAAYQSHEAGWLVVGLILAVIGALISWAQGKEASRLSKLSVEEQMRESGWKRPAQ